MPLYDAVKHKGKPQSSWLISLEAQHNQQDNNPTLSVPVTTGSIRTAPLCRKTVMRRVFLCFSAKATAHRENYDGSVHLRKDSVTSIDQPEKKLMSNFKVTHQGLRMWAYPSFCLHTCFRLKVLHTFRLSLHLYEIDGLNWRRKLTCIHKDAPLAVQIWLERNDLRGRLSKAKGIVNVPLRLWRRLLTSSPIPPFDQAGCSLP